MEIPTKRNLDTAKISKVAEVLKTIAHPVRLAIMEALEFKEPQSVNELRTNLDLKIEQSLLSHHLIKMKDKGVLTSEKVGMNVFYKLSDRQLVGIFDCMDRCELFK
jgi:ArsR family transcriptional regulator